MGRLHHTPVGRQRERVGGVSGARRLRALRQHGEARLLGDGDGAAAPRDTQGRQANGKSGGGRSSLAAAQVRVLHEGHRSHVPVPVAGEDHTVPSHAVPQRSQQGDDQRRRVLDNYQHRQGRVSVLRGYGTGAQSRHAGAARSQFTLERRR